MSKEISFSSCTRELNVHLDTLSYNELTPRVEYDDQGNEIVKLKQHDFMGEIGFGIDMYLPYFKFSPQIKLVHGLINLLSKDETVYTKSIKKLTTNGWILSFTFE